ncbi:hypothetical protein PIB30_106058 [Stylosanthes scabra]|uniref:Uncharacterized protein n=1 Tax=Stylosanthes scabra TaxID=79078 RepID=A0ABU6XWK6_9FABA|nr:hypothetical protein [Stylosanthes scabra]
MAGLFNKKRKGKALAESSSEVPRFKTLYHEAHFKSKLPARKVLPELAIDYNDEILSPCAMQIKMRKWEKLTAPLPAIGHNLAQRILCQCMGAGQSQEEAIHLHNNASYEERKANKDYRLEEVLECLCLEGREWVRHKDGRPYYLRRNDLEPMAKGWYDFVCRSIMPTTNRSELTVERAVVPHKDDTMIPQETPIAGEAMVRTRETRPRQPRQEVPPPQQPPQIYRRLDQQQEENRKSFEAINTRMDRMDDQLSFLCYSNQMVNETMYYPYQNIARQFREMEAQGVPVTIANLAIHRHREEEMNRERMRHNQTVQEAAS